MLPPGIHKAIPCSIYNEHPAIRSSHLKILLSEQPIELKHALSSTESKTSDALLKGELLHAMLLEPKTLDERFIFEREQLRDKNKLEKNGGSKERWDALKAMAEASGKPIVSHDIYTACQGMADSIRRPRSDSEKSLWDKVERFGEKELTMIADIDGVRCKVRLDAFLQPRHLPAAIIDIKTTSKGLSDREVTSTILEREYLFSAAMYISVAESLGITVDSFRWLFLQTEPPYQFRYFKAPADWIERGKLEFRKTLEIYRICATTDNWPGYFGQSIDTLPMPEWYPKRVYPWGTL